MKICFVTTNFPRHVNDSEGTFVWEAARAIARLGHQVRVVAQHWPGLPTHEWMENVEVFRPRYWWPESAEILRQPGGGLPIVWRRSRSARIQVLPFIAVHTLTVARQARDCDIIHAQWTLSAAAAWLSRPWHGRPIVATLQGSDIFQVVTNRWGALQRRYNGSAMPGTAQPRRRSVYLPPISPLYRMVLTWRGLCRPVKLAFPSLCMSDPSSGARG
jgi:hypothetical protein